VEEGNSSWGCSMLNQYITYMCVYLIYGVQNTLNMQSMLLLGGLGACPPENFEKIEARRWDLVEFQPLGKVGKLFIIACNF